ncbi:hypothetical protein TREMEDRAFT_29918 [Tremella mesenterica DSM 1558]|uniref:uncharacterized protein n=1 Tax=Tremella mesenterica (strain ATCC 24925 / CBS 8224 / DSM 1558 / NBRC 9311 / NRRL Y-6157 / RJB 2259-6 / UBC 559-6) TaxID=578456 RepID=UPI0003F49D29|nr:uncharacterized protein TREMEDRAFT_29918 [Tremella mesenterica DSM 1558]EIW70077.1 hypothetical protein TREMEDRAFT_29918 [Tremella mesenterica DSM 1558]
MTSVMSNFDGPRPQSQHGIHSSPHESPRIPRPASQASLHLPPGAYHAPSPNEGHPLTAFPGGGHSQPYKYQQPPGLSLPLPNQGYMGGYPNTAPLFPGSAPIYDARSQPMMRTISQAHPMNSASEHMSSRYSASPHSATGNLNHDSPPSASLPNGQFIPGLHVSHDNRHVNPALFSGNMPGFSSSMSRSTSGASEVGPDGRLLTPHYDALSPGEHELRKVSDSLGRNRPYQHGYPGFEFQHHGVNLGPHPQPDAVYYTRGYPGDNYVMSDERGMKPELATIGETDYERERQVNIINNKKLLDDVGLGGGQNPFVRSREANGMSPSRNRKASTPSKNRALHGAVRASPRIASLHRNVSYADPDGGPVSDDDSGGEDAYGSDNAEEEDDFRPMKRTKGVRNSYTHQVSYVPARKTTRKPDLSLWGLLQVYGEIPHKYPLFYYTLNNDLTINSDSVPLIGSIPSTCTPLEKAETLRAFFQRGRRVLAQLDAFTARCDRKYEGPEERWTELEYHTRIAIRDVRRKVVERCENYKYTRRDLLDKMLGKGKWQSIEQGMVEWRESMHPNNDPANDLANVTLTMPTPPPSVYANQHQEQQRAAYPGRMIKPFPARSRPASVNRVMSVNMDYNPNMMYSYPHTAPPAPGQAMYGEDQVPMTVQMPPASAGAGPSGDHMNGTLAPQWEGYERNQHENQENRGEKRQREEEQKGENLNWGGETYTA